MGLLIENPLVARRSKIRLSSPLTSSSDRRPSITSITVPFILANLRVLQYYPDFGDGGQAVRLNVYVTADLGVQPWTARSKSLAWVLPVKYLGDERPRLSIHGRIFLLVKG